MTLARFAFTDRATPVVELGIGDTRVDIGVALWDSAHWDNATDATWSGAMPTWLDVSCFVHECTFTYGRSRNTDRFAPGTASLVLANDSGLADIDTDDIATVSLRPGRMLRIGVDHVVFGRRWLWCGYVDAVAPTYDPTYHDVVNVEAICALGEVGRVEVPEIATPVGDGELASTRVIRVLNAARWPSARRSIAATGVPMLPTTLGAQAADLLGVAADSAGGSVWGDTNGHVVFRGRDWQMYPASDVPDGDIGNVAADSYCPTAWSVSSRREDIVTVVILGRTIDDVPLEWTQAQGLALFGPETYRATDLECSQQSQLSVLMSRIFRTRGWSVTPRIEFVEFNAATGLQSSRPAIDLMTTVDVFEPSRYRCRLALERGQIFDGNMYATGVRHTMTADEWTCHVDLDLATPYRAVGGRWDQESYWDSAVWN